MRAAIYYRVSTGDQSPRMQMRELRAYAKKRKFKVAGEYLDKNDFDNDGDLDNLVLPP